MHLHSATIKTNIGTSRILLWTLFLGKSRDVLLVRAGCGCPKQQHRVDPILTESLPLLPIHHHLRGATHSAEEDDCAGTHLEIYCSHFLCAMQKFLFVRISACRGTQLLVELHATVGLLKEAGKGFPVECAVNSSQV